jgi:WD40 repeat protein
MSSNDLKVTTNSKYILSPPILKAPFALDSLERYEMGGLAVYPLEEHDKFVTCSDDGYVRIWSVKDRALTGSLELTLNTKGEQVPKSDDSKLKCISINKSGVAAVGCKSGLIRVGRCYQDRRPEAVAADPRRRSCSGMHQGSQVCS